MEVERLIEQVRILNGTHTKLMLNMTEFKLATCTLWGSSSAGLKRVNETLLIHESGLEKLRSCVELLNTSITSVVEDMRVEREILIRTVETRMAQQLTLIHDALEVIENRTRSFSTESPHVQEVANHKELEYHFGFPQLAVSPFTLAEMMPDDNKEVMDLCCGEVMDWNGFNFFQSDD